MAHPVVHFEIAGPDDRQLAEFYAGLFGWGMQPVHGIGYTLVTTGAGINGGIEKVSDIPPRTIFYIQAEDLQTVLDKINLVGGKTVTPITELPGMATYAHFEDLDGLVVGLVLGPTAGAPEQPAPQEGSGAPLDWFEVLGTDAKRSQQFYAEIFGWQLTVADSGYGMVDTGTDRGIRGSIGGGEPVPRATVYASVPDVAATLGQAAELGGSRADGPVVVDDNLQTGALRDPAGNVVGVYHRGPH
jgi:predicted enzyme related to lactoylglutathione lyase